MSSEDDSIAHSTTEFAMEYLKRKGIDRVADQRSAKKQRGSYKCTKCGAPKKGHKCSMPDAKPQARTKIHIPDCPAIIEVSDIRLNPRPEEKDSEHPTVPVIPTSKIPIDFTEDRVEGSITAREMSQTVQDRVDGAVDKSSKARAAYNPHKRGGYRCKKCGEKKRGHICTGAPVSTLSDSSLAQSILTAGVAESVDMSIHLPPQYHNPADGRVSPISLAITETEPAQPLVPTTHVWGNDGIEKLDDLLQDFPVPRGFTRETLLDQARTGDLLPVEAHRILSDALRDPSLPKQFSLGIECVVVFDLLTHAAVLLLKQTRSLELSNDFTYM